MIWRNARGICTVISRKEHTSPKTVFQEAVKSVKGAGNQSETPPDLQNHSEVSCTVAAIFSCFVAFPAVRAALLQPFQCRAESCIKTFGCLSLYFRSYPDLPF